MITQGLVPIVEPEVLLKGDHTLERCYDVDGLARCAHLAQQLVGAENGYVFSGMVPAIRPTADYTARVIRFRAGVAVLSKQHRSYGKS